PIGGAHKPVVCDLATQRGNCHADDQSFRSVLTAWTTWVYGTTPARSPPSIRTTTADPAPARNGPSAPGPSITSGGPAQCSPGFAAPRAADAPRGPVSARGPRGPPCSCPAPVSPFGPGLARERPRTASHPSA